MRSLRLFLSVATLAFLIVLPLGLLFGQGDTLPGPIPASGPVSFAAALLIGLAAAGGTKLVGSAASAADKAIGSVDSSVRKVIGPVLPAITVGLSVLLPMIGSKIGVVDLPPADVVANAPLAAIIGVTAREAVRKWILPLVGR